jgi:streptomycin 6-kinase
MISIPEGFEKRIRQTHGQKGDGWLRSLKETIGFCEQHWKIKILEPFDLSFNYVTRIRFGNGTEGVLKLWVPGKDCSSEINTLRIYEGVSMCKLIDCIEERGILLMERLNPGSNLKTISYDVAAVKIAALLIKKMQRQSVKSNNFQSISDWATGISKLRDHFNGGSGPFPETIVKRVESLFPNLISTQKNSYLLHGDFHHGNILLSNGEWKLIDPKGVTGEIEYEMIPFIVNNLPDDQFERVIDTRIQTFQKELGTDSDRVYAWGLCHMLLSGWWNIEDNLGVSDRDLSILEHFNSKIVSKLDL